MNILTPQSSASMASKKELKPVLVMPLQTVVQPQREIWLQRALQMQPDGVGLGNRGCDHNRG
jgi:hypothetical protein